MRKWIYVLPLAACIMAAGCGNSKSNWTPEGSTAKVDTYTLEDFSSGNVATLMISNGNEDRYTYAVESNGYGSESRVLSKNDSEFKVRDLPVSITEATSKELAESNKRLAKSNAMAFSRNTKYTELAKGATVQLWAGSSGIEKLTFKKILSEDEAKHTIILAEVKDGEAALTEAEAKNLDLVFGEANPNDPDGLSIKERVNETFGKEWTDGGGIDGTSKIVIAVMHQSTMGEGLYGYFWSRDEYPTTEQSKSNMAEMLYLGNTKESNGDDVDVFDLYSTIAHEFQHMCHFNQKALHDGKYDGEEDLLALNEGCSVLSEDLCGYGLDCDEGGSYFIYSCIASYFKAPEEYNLQSFSNYPGDYGQCYLFMRYLTDRYGIDTVNKICTSSTVGFPSITANIDTSFSDVFRDWGLANLMNGLTGTFSSKYTYKNLSFNAEYDVTGIGKVTLDGVEPMAGAMSTEETEQRAYSNSYYKYTKASDSDLVVQAAHNSKVNTNMLKESVAGKYEDVQ